MTTREMNFDQALSRLEVIVRELENGQLPLENALELFAEGVALSKVCNKKLEQAEKKISRLITDSQGQPVLVRATGTLSEGGLD
ncbi:exodeoxyribonuclease VII, small subunit [Desulfofarcimen acetoxidans DSM 771]|uniref:Exodeoxyribonuclease 7 small subunit n=1 Tax=Desulfofarcimen acetoxidans (strain ATCC 49208 / DSM 771 / KCTC 5769 / VKM B-1644 / 5575) TaxID=485916 RepID=C8W0Y4_DESAS|nr:exodeoxyribonuclease VII small subunit [Desulfofarcimen acetoxidans]ACV63380.1 exodeoxyribonuclease VII, small subunit [Desulfofarcimen acetoxidans DSM 771]